MATRPVALRATVPPLVLVSVSADSLHLLAHRAQLSARTAQDWWDNPLDTALAAISCTRHPVAFRRDGEVALERLRRWHRDGHPRRVSADSAALALTARVATDLARRDRVLEDAAVEAVRDLGGRGEAAAPALHVALAAWALDPLISDREAAPWPQLREHADAAPRFATGVEGPLRLLTTELSASSADAGSLVRSLLNEMPSSPGVEDGAVLLWIATVAIERCASQMESTDSGLRALAERRAELAERLSQEITAETFQPPLLTDFNPDTPLDARPVVYLSPTEALLLDCSLASARPHDAWLRFEEADQLFGRRERQTRTQLARRTAALIALLGLTVAGLSGVIATWSGLKFTVTVPATFAIGWVFWLVATTIIYRDSARPMTQAFGMLLATGILASAFMAINQALTKPLLDDIAGVIASGILGLVVAVVGQILFAAQRR